MFTWLKDFYNFLFKSYSVVAAFAFLALSGLALGADPVEVEVTTPDIEWGTVASDLVGALTAVVVVGLGVAISVWVLMLIARIFKRSAS